MDFFKGLFVIAFLIIAMFIEPITDYLMVILGW